MLPGVVPFPPEFAQRYRERGYWAGKSLAEELSASLERFSTRVAAIDRDRSFTYRELQQLSDNLALNLLTMGLEPLDRVIVQLPNTAEFVVLYLALQKIGCIPVVALPAHRYTEIAQFVRLSGAKACFIPERQGDFNHTEMLQRIRLENSELRYGVVLGNPPAGLTSLSDLIEAPAKLPVSKLSSIVIDPTDPAVFQLSSGTTGIPKLIPRTHNDYAYNSRAAAGVANIGGDTIMLLVLPVAHNLPLACPGIQGCFFHGGRVVLGMSTKPEDVFSLIQKHRATHLKVVPALLVRLLNDPSIANYDLSSLRTIQSGGQRLQPEVRLLSRKLIPSAFIQENFGMAEGLLMYVRRDDPPEVQLETVGRPVCPDDEVRLIGDDGRDVPDGDVGELCCRGPYTLRGYFGVPEYNQRAFTPDGFYRTGDLMRRHPSGNYMVEGRKKDLINRGGEKISAEEIENLILSHPAVKNVACIPVPDSALGERMCACIILRNGAELNFEALQQFLQSKEIAKFKWPERLELLSDFPMSGFGKVSKKDLVALVTGKMAALQP